MKVSEIIRLIEKEGWRLVRQKGSHRQFKHAKKTYSLQFRGIECLMATGTLKSIFKQAQIKS